MSKETQDQAVDDQQAKPEGEAGAEAEAGAASAEAKRKPITLELDELTEESKQREQERTGKAPRDLEYTLASREERPGSALALRFEVTRELFDAEQQRLIGELGRDVTLPGFRKGKAPIKLLRLRLGEDANRDTVAFIASNVLRQENIANNFKLVSKPQVEKFELPADPKAPVSIEVELEQEPKVELKQYKGLRVEVIERPLEEKAIEQRVEALRQQNAVLEPAPEDATVQAGDILTVDTVVTSERGERMENMSGEGRQLYDWREQLPAPVAEQIEGKKVGETVAAKVEQKSTNRRGDEVVHTDAYEVTVRGIQRHRLPALDDEFAKDLGEYDTLEALKAKIRGELETEETERRKGEAVGKLYQALIEANPVDAPKSFLARQQYEMIMQDQYQLERMGMRLEHLVHDPDAYLAEQRQGAEKRVKAHLIEAEIARAENLGVSDEDVEQEIAKIAEQTGRKPLAVRARLEAQRQLDDFRAELGRRKVAEFLLANNEVAGVPAPAEPEGGPVGEGENAGA